MEIYPVLHFDMSTAKSLSKEGLENQFMGKLYAASRKEPLYLFFSPAAYPRKEHNC